MLASEKEFNISFEIGSTPHLEGDREYSPSVGGLGALPSRSEVGGTPYLLGDLEQPLNGWGVNPISLGLPI
jgi:hypothetical protein